MALNVSSCTINVPGLIESSKLHETVFQLCDQALRSNDRSGLKEILLQLDGHAIDEVLVKGTDRYIDFIHPGIKKIASVKTNRLPGRDELVIIFGNYPLGFNNLVANNPIRRNVLEFGDFRFDVVESARCWDPVSRIFIINRDDRPDRYYSCVRELARMGAPLDRTIRLSARIGSSGLSRELNGQEAWWRWPKRLSRGLRRIKRSLHGVPSPSWRQLNGAIGCLRSHLAAVRLTQEEGFDNVMILEDDFSFTDNTDSHQDALTRFFGGRYNYDVCLLATSRRGLIFPKDELVSYTRQPCTNTGGYLVSREGAVKLVECFSKALYKLLETGDTMRFAVDRCWAELQGERFLVLKDRIGFQLPSYSNIEGIMAAYFD